MTEARSKVGPFGRRVMSVVAALAACVAVPARAEGGGVKPDETAVRLYRESAEQYRLGNFAETARLLRLSYGRNPDPVLLYNLARACEGMDDVPCAIDAYERYLAAADPPDRGAIEKRILRYKRRLAKPPPPPAPVVARRPSAIPWVIAGTGAVGMGIGMSFGLMAKSERDRADGELVQAIAADKQANAENMATVANVALAAGGAVLVAGLVWGIIDLRQTRAASPNAHPSTGWQMRPTASGIELTF